MEGCRVVKWRVKWPDGGVQGGQMEGGVAGSRGGNEMAGWRVRWPHGRVQGGRMESGVAEWRGSSVKVSAQEILRTVLPFMHIHSALNMSAFPYTHTRANAPTCLPACRNATKTACDVTYDCVFGNNWCVSLYTY